MTASKEDLLANLAEAEAAAEALHSKHDDMIAAGKESEAIVEAADAEVTIARQRLEWATAGREVETL